MTQPSVTLLPPNAGDAFWIVGDLIAFKLGPAQTRGQFAFAETTVVPGGGPPPHVHFREDEMFYILEGNFAFIHGEHSLTGGPGDAFYLAKGIVHTFKNISDKPGRLLVAATPPGFDKFVPEAGDPCLPGSVPPPLNDAAIAKLTAACKKYGLEMKFDFKPGPPAPPRPADRELWVLGTHVRLKLTSADTGGKFTAAEVTCAPGAGVPVHSHREMDEVFRVLAGEFEFMLDDKAFAAPAGTFIHVPPGVMHGFRNAGKTDAMLIDYHSPGGFEKFFEECGVPCTDRAAPPAPPSPDDMPRIMQIIEKHGMAMPAAKA